MRNLLQVVSKPLNYYSSELLGLRLCDCQKPGLAASVANTFPIHANSILLGSALGDRPANSLRV